MNVVARLHVVTDDVVLARDAWTSRAIEVLEAGGSRLALQIRGPRTSGARLFELGSRLATVAEHVGAALAINDRVDVAMALGMSTLHLGRRSLGLVEARALLGKTAVVGVSCHSVDEVALASSEGADYAFLGNVFDTPSHPDRRGMGLEALGKGASAAGRLPVLAIGGMSVDRVEDVLSVGAYGVASVRGVWGADRPGEAVYEYISLLSTADAEDAGA